MTLIILLFTNKAVYVLKTASKVLIPATHHTRTCLYSPAARRHRPAAGISQ